MNIYATPGQVKEQIDKESTVDDGHLLRVLVSASRLIDEAAGRFFFPKRQAVAVDVADAENGVWLPLPLLAAEEVALSGDGGRTYAQTLAADDYYLSDGLLGQTPYQLLEVVGSCSGVYSGRRAMRITGTWGWRRDYAGAWVDLDTVQDNPLLAGATSLTVDNAMGPDEMGIAPRFGVGQLLRVDNEFVSVTGVTVTVGGDPAVQTSVLTVRRAQNGTAAAVHAQGTAIEVWRPEPMVVQATITQAARTFKRGLAGFEDASANVETGQVMYVKRLDPDVELMLYEAGLRRVTVG